MHVALAALRLASVAAAQVRKSARRAGREFVEDEMLPAAQRLVMLMVHHGDAGVRREACRTLQNLVRCLNPGVADALCPRSAPAILSLRTLCGTRAPCMSSLLCVRDFHKARNQAKGKGALPLRPSLEALTLPWGQLLYSLLCTLVIMRGHSLLRAH